MDYGKKKMMYGGMNRQKKMYGSKAKMMGGGRAMYGTGGYTSVADMAKKCAAMTVTKSSLGEKLRDPSA